MSVQLEPDEDYCGLRRPEETLPSYFYFDPAHYERELATFWYKRWVYICRASDLAEPRSFRTFKIGNQPVLLLRDEAGALRAFHNTCRHRGAELCGAESGRFTSKRIICPYHQWTYSLQGDLQRTSSLQEPDGFDRAAFPLYDLAVVEWRGFVFVNLAGKDATPFAESFDATSDKLDNWPLPELVSLRSYRKVMNCNWKLFWDNFNECLHCPAVHPGLSKLVPIYGRAIMSRREDPHWRDHADDDDPKYRGGLRQGAETWSMDGKPSKYTFSDLTPAERAAGYSYMMSAPSMFLAAHVDYVRVVRLLPLGPEQTELTAEFLFPPEAAADPAFDPSNAVDFITQVLEEDAGACEMNQRGLKAMPHGKGVLMPEDYVLKDFRDWILAELEGS
ncbi:MAG TPA: aromatic ring-hydroxylating dioxygenase subunit alpha [Kiloniellaceae bacterium]|nr:aromatic ring-hydroxylating dioxygenase subunit alpha [Kiloniellaceae bacterium]